jgi:Domain of unknown function (DUF4372)
MDKAGVIDVIRSYSCQSRNVLLTRARWGVGNGPTPDDPERARPAGGQFVAMLCCQLAQAKSLREITEGLQAGEGKLKHLGLPEAPARSTLAYANSHPTE